VPRSAGVAERTTTCATEMRIAVCPTVIGLRATCRHRDASSGDTDGQDAHGPAKPAGWSFLAPGVLASSVPLSSRHGDVDDVRVGVKLLEYRF
jgi:hypothetical protein